MKEKEAAGGSGKGAEVDIGLCHSMREEAEVPDNIRQVQYQQRHLEIFSPFLI